MPSGRPGPHGELYDTEDGSIFLFVLLDGVDCVEDGLGLYFHKQINHVGHVSSFILFPLDHNQSLVHL
jgi:hypothetical protein